MKRLLFILLLVPLVVFADGAVQNNSLFLLPKGEVVEGDLVARGKSVEIAGRVTGDLYALGGQVTIDGVVDGDLLVLGGKVRLDGEVKGSVRLFGGQTFVSGKVGKSASFIAGSVEMTDQARIARNCLVISGYLDMDGVIQGTLDAYATSIRVSGAVNNGLKAHTSQLRLASGAKVKGEVDYWSNHDVMIDDGAQVSGKVEEHSSIIYSALKGSWIKRFQIGSRVATLFMNFCFTLIFGLVMFKFFPDNLRRAVIVLQKKPIHAFLTGVLMVLILPALCLALFVTILGIPFALTLVAFNVIGFYTVKIVPIVWLSKKVFSHVRFEKYRKTYYILGLVCYFTLTALPYVGTWVSALALFLGLGALTMGRKKHLVPHH